MKDSLGNQDLSQDQGVNELGGKKVARTSPHAKEHQCEGPDRREGGEDGKTYGGRSQRALWTMIRSSKKLVEHFKNYLTCI